MYKTNKGFSDKGSIRHEDPPAPPFGGAFFTFDCFFIILDANEVSIC